MMTDEKSRGIGFNIPKIKRQISKDNLRNVNINSRDAQDVVDSDSKYGLHLCKHADLQLRFADTWGVDSCSVFIFKIYLYEYNEDYETVERPRHCLPHAIVEYEKAEEVPTTTGYGSKASQRQSSHGYERSRPRGSENTGYGHRMSKTQNNTNKIPVSKVPDAAQRNNQTAAQQAPARRQSWDSWQTSTNSDGLNISRSEIQDSNVYENKGKEEESDSSIQEVEMEDVSGINLENTESKDTMYKVQVGDNETISSISALSSHDHKDSNTKQTKTEIYLENLNSKKIEDQNINEEKYLSTIPLPEDCRQNKNKSSEISSVNSESDKKVSAIMISGEHKKNKETDIQTKYNTTGYVKAYNQRQNIVSTQHTVNEVDLYDPTMPTFSPEPVIEEDPYQPTDTPSPQDSIDRSKSPAVGDNDNSGSLGNVYTHENKKVFDASEVLQDVDLRLERTFSPLDVDMRVEQNSCSSTDVQSESNHTIHTSQSLYSLQSNQSNSSLNQVLQNNPNSTTRSSSDLQTQHEIINKYSDNSSVMDVDMRKFARNSGMKDIDLRYSGMDTDLRAARDQDDNQHTADLPYSGRSTPVKDELPFYGGDFDHGSNSAETVRDIQNDGKNNNETSSKEDYQKNDQDTKSILHVDTKNIKQEPDQMNAICDIQTQKPAPSDDLSFLSIVKSEKGHGIIYTTNLIEEHGIPGFTSSSVYQFPEVKKEIVDSEMDSTTHRSTESVESLVGSNSSKIGAVNSDVQDVMAPVKTEDLSGESLKHEKAKKNLDFSEQEKQSNTTQKKQNKQAGKSETENEDGDNSVEDMLSESDINISDKRGTLSIKITNSYSLAHVKTPEKQKTTQSPSKKSPLKIKREESQPVVLTLRQNSLSDDENQDDFKNSKTNSSTSSGDSRRVVTVESPLMKSTPAKDTFLKPNSPKHSAYTYTPFDDSGSSLGLISCDGSYISEKEHLSNSPSNSSEAGVSDSRRVVLSSDESRNPIKVERDLEIIRKTDTNLTPQKQENIDNISLKSEPQDIDMRDTSHSSSQTSTSSSGQKSKPKMKKINKDMMGYRTRKRRRKKNKNMNKDTDTHSNCSMEILSTTSSDILDNHDDFDTSSNRSSDRRTCTPPVCGYSSHHIKTLADFGLSHWSEALKSGIFQPKILLTDITTKGLKTSDSCKDISLSDQNIQNSPSKIIQELPVSNADEDYPQQKQDMVKQWLQIARKKIKLTLKPKQSTKQTMDECETKTNESGTQRQITQELDTQQAPAEISVKDTEKQGMIPVLHKRVATPITTKIGPLCSKLKMKSETVSQKITDSNKNMESPQTKTILSVPSISRTISSHKPVGSNNSEPVQKTEQIQTSQVSNIEPLSTITPTENISPVSGQPINRLISQDIVKQIHSSVQSNSSLYQGSPKKVVSEIPTQPVWTCSNQETPAQNPNQTAQLIQHQQVPGVNSSVPQAGQPIQIQSIANQQQPVLNIPAPPVPLAVSNAYPTMSTRPPTLNTAPNMEVNKQFSGAPLQIGPQNTIGHPLRFPLHVVPPLTMPPPRIPLINAGNVQMRQNLVVPSVNQRLPHQIPAMSASIHVPMSQPVQILPVRQGMPPPPTQVQNSPHNMMQNRPQLVQNAPPVNQPGNPSQPKMLSADILRGPPPQAHQQIQVANNRNVSQITSQPPPGLGDQARPVYQIPTTLPTQPRQLLSQPRPLNLPQTRPTLLSQPRPPFSHPPPPVVPQYVTPGQVNLQIQTNRPAQVTPSASPNFPGNQIPSLINKQVQTPQRKVSIVHQFMTMPSAQNSQSPNQGVQMSNLVNVPSSTIPVITGRQTVISPQVKGQTSTLLSSQTGTKRSKDPLDWFSDMIAPKKRPALDQNSSLQSLTSQQGGTTEPVIHSSSWPVSSTPVQAYPSHPVQVVPVTGNPQVNQNIRPHSSADHFLGDSCQHMCAGPTPDADILDLQPSDESLFDSSLDEKSIDILSEKQLMIKKALNELEGAGSGSEIDICKTADDNNNDHDSNANTFEHEQKCSNEIEHSDLEDGEIDEDLDSENSEAIKDSYDSDMRKVQIHDTGSIHINVSFLDKEQFPWSKPTEGHLSDNTSQSDSDFVQDNMSSPQTVEKKKPFFSPNSHLINTTNTKQNIKDIANSWSQMLMTKDNRIERVRGDNSNDQHKGTKKNQVKKMRTEDIKTLGDFAIFETKDDNILSLQKYVSVDMSIEISSLSKNKRKTMKKRLLTELENTKVKIAAGTECEIIDKDSTTSDKALVMKVTDINDEASHLTRHQLEEELRLIRQCISKSWKDNNKIPISNSETETQLRQDLQTLESEIMARINSLQIENVGSVNRRVPKGLLLESENSEFFSEEGVFLILTCTVSKKIYKKLIKLKEDIRIINVALPRYNSIEDSSKISQLKQKRRDLQLQRRTLMMTFTGLLTKKRVTKIKTKLKFYNRVHSYLKEQYGEQFNRSFLYLNEVLSDLVKHDILASNLLKNPKLCKLIMEFLCQKIIDALNYKIVQLKSLYLICFKCLNLGFDNIALRSMRIAFPIELMVNYYYVYNALYHFCKFLYIYFQKNGHVIHTLVEKESLQLASINTVPFKNRTDKMYSNSQANMIYYVQATVDVVPILKTDLNLLMSLDPFGKLQFLIF
ncbi:hypothetical protein KUTeg_003136 [Tegillarca granosa]|uniref:Uncharacterized protein n=1 Tax=Tegillarca granosa TaxID=220873 RepID=A0ABQ9FQP8_TEGGR|nr:hypothetical protein KUTeg_003136 [Tegillarca granosa]